MSQKNPFATNLLPESAEFDLLAKKQDQELGDLLNDVERVASTPHGARVFRHLLERCHIFQSSMTGNAYTNFLEGERQVGLHIQSLLVMASPQHAADVLLGKLWEYAKELKERTKVE